MMLRVVRITLKVLLICGYDGVITGMMWLRSFGCICNNNNTAQNLIIVVYWTLKTKLLKFVPLGSNWDTPSTDDAYTVAVVSLVWATPYKNKRGCNICDWQRTSEGGKIDQ